MGHVQLEKGQWELDFVRHYVQAMALSNLEDLHANRRSDFPFDFISLQEGSVFDVVDEAFDV